MPVATGNSALAPKQPAPQPTTADSGVLYQGGAISTPGRIKFNPYQSSGSGGSTYGGGSGNFDPSSPFANGIGTSGDPYNQLRNSATQEASNSQAQGMDAIARRFAAQGGGGSGAEIQAMTDLNRNAAGARESAIGNINAMEQQQALPYAQMKEQAAQFGQGQDLAREQLGEQSNEFGANLQLGENQQDLDTAANNINSKIAAFQAQNSGGQRLIAGNDGGKLLHAGCVVIG